ncbi:unnamed protein product, partial [Mycena citricolor]
METLLQFFTDSHGPFLQVSAGPCCLTPLICSSKLGGLMLLGNSISLAVSFCCLLPFHLVRRFP